MMRMPRRLSWTIAAIILSGCSVAAPSPIAGEVAQSQDNVPAHDSVAQIVSDALEQRLDQMLLISGPTPAP